MCDKIPTVRITFKHLPDFIISEEDYKNVGGFNGFCKENCINKKDVKKVKHLVMDSKDYPLNAWEG